MIEVGEYVRTKSGKIDKVINDDYYMSLYIECEKGLVEIENIVKYSKNLIDLIEEGDYVNGHRILEKTKIINGNMMICILKDNNSSNWRTINNETLKSIVTKEQFKSVEYIVEGR